jgi:opacity protein-like surface antigen
MSNPEEHNDALKNKFDSFELDSPTAGWESFEKKFSESEAEGGVVGSGEEDALKGKFEGFEKGANSAGWNVFEGKRVRKRRRRIALWTVIALLFIASLVGLFGDFAGGDNGSQLSSQKTEETIVDEKVKSDFNEEGESVVSNDGSGEIENKVESDNVPENSTADISNEEGLDSGPDKLNEGESENGSENENTPELPLVSKEQTPNKELNNNISEEGLSNESITTQEQMEEWNKNIWIARRNNIDPLKLQTPEISIKEESEKPKKAENTDIKTFPLFSVTVSMGPTLSGQKLRAKSGANEYVHKNYGDYRSSSQKPTIGYEFNASVNYMFIKGLSFKSGVGFNQYNVGGKYDFQVDSIPVYDIDNTIAGYVGNRDTVGQGFESFSARQSYTYVTIPFGLAYSFKATKKWSVLAEVGGEMNLLTSSSGRILNEEDVFSSQPISETSVRRTNYSLNLGLGVTRKVYKNFSLGVGARYSRFISPANNTGRYEAINYSYGLGILARYEF